MKRIFSSVIFPAVVLLGGCAKEVASEQLLEEGTVIRDAFHGYSFDCVSQPDYTKIVFGKEEGGNFPCLWEEGDGFSIRTSGGTTVGTADLVSGAGRRFGSFDFTVKSAQSEGTPVRVIYPKKKMTSFNSNTLDSDQYQKGGGYAVCDMSAYSFAYADMNYSPSSFPTEFTLTHILSYVCLRLSAENTGYKGLAVDQVKMQCDGVALSGGFSTNYKTLAVTPTSPADYVRVIFDGPVTITEGEVDVWLAVLPCDLRSKKVNVTLSGTYKGQNVSIPLVFDGIALEANKAALIDKSCFHHDSSLSDDWYEPVDGRTMVGEGYCYGPENTFIIQCKNGSTYNGGTYQPVDEYPSSVTFDFRARGDRNKCSDPKNFNFGWATKNYTIATKASECYLPTTSGFSSTLTDPSGYSFSVDRENYTITVTAVSAHAGSPILIMADDTGKIVWGWTFWNIAADGTRLEQIDIHNPGSGTIKEYYVSLANMDIGQPTTNYAAFSAANGSNENKEQVARFINRYQWGRYLPVFWHSWPSLNFSDGSNSGNIPARKDGPVSLEESLKYPYGLITAPKNSSITDWNSSPDGSLWGNMSATYTTKGVKTNYDPCPKGWRVPDEHTMTKWKTWANGKGIIWNSSAGQMGVITGGAFFAVSGVYKNSIGNETVASSGFSANGLPDTSPYAGWWGSHTYQDVCTPNILQIADNSTSSNPKYLSSGSWSSGQDYYHAERSAAYRSYAYAVRCMPDFRNN